MTEPPPELLVVFTVDEMRIALGIETVSRVVRAAAISPLPGAPPHVRGVVNVHGEIVPVFDLRTRLNLDRREIRTSDHFVIARSGSRTVAVTVDTVVGIVNASDAAVISPDEWFSKNPTIQNAISVEGETVLIHDLQQFLSPGEDAALSASLQNHQ